MWRITAALLFLALWASSSPAGSWSPDGKRIAYSFIGGPEDLYVMDADGGRPHAILVREQRDFQPEWAPDGSFLVFTSVEQGAHVIMKIAPDGTGLTALSEPSEGAADPDVSPDGKRIVFFSSDPRPLDLHVKSLETGATDALTNTPAFSELSPRWSPDGRSIVFVGRDTTRGARGDLWIMDVAKRTTRNITGTAEVDEFHPAWSHDGTRVVYVRNAGGVFDVAIRALKGGRESILARGNGFAVLAPHFSRDDRYVTFTRTDFNEVGPGMPAIVKVSLEDGTETKLVEGLYLSQR